MPGVDKLEVKELMDKTARISSMGEGRKYNTLRMKKINIEDIYPQAEKDREGEKLKQLCDMHET